MIKFKLLTAVALSFCIAAATMFGGAALATNAPSDGTAEETAEEYRIYPQPHEISYTGGSFEVTEEVNLVCGNVDEYTVAHMYESLACIDVIAVGEMGGTRILLGIYGSGDEADLFVRQRADGLDNLFTKTDSYILYADDGVIAVVGRDTDAAYYGVSTLNMIFTQTEGRAIRSLVVKDYSDSTYRGFIEGYYGVPWTCDERIELMKFGSRFKTNIYIYAPKDDPYHSSNWRGLYSDADLAKLKEQIEAGARTKTRFAWALHPFIRDEMTEENYDADLQTVINKFEQLYGAGVRQFVISADDVSVDLENGSIKLDATLHKNLLNAVCEWQREKGDCYDLIFVPSAYCYMSESRLRVDLEYYFETLSDGLDGSVNIMWTGNDVCSTLQTGRFEEFTALTGRKAFMWLNWPVNDYAPSALLLGKAEVLNKKYENAEDIEFTGIVTNPLQHSELSKLSIFAVADYCWNIGGFDTDESYKASFGYVESNAPDELYELCLHLANATKYEGEYFEESAAINEYIQSFTAAYKAGNDLVEKAEALAGQFKIIREAAEVYLDGAANAKLKEQIEPWARALAKMSEAAEKYLYIITWFDLMDKDELTAAIDEADAIYASVKDCKSPVLNTVTYNADMVSVQAGVAVLSPFLNELSAITADMVDIETGRSTGITYRGFAGIYSGSCDDICDGDDGTFVWFDGTPEEGAYVRIDLGEKTELRSVRILTGKPDGGDVMYGYAEYSADGKNYTRLCELNGAETFLDLRSAPVEARYIRLCNDGTQTWIAIRDVSFNTVDDIETFVTYGVIELESVSDSINAVIDGDLSTFAWFTVNRTEGAFLALEFKEPKTVENVQLLMAKNGSPDDYFRSVRLEYSLDGESWTELGIFSGRSIYYTLPEAVVAKYVRAVSLQTTENGVVVRDFSVNAYYPVSVGDGYKPYDYYRDGYPITHVYYAADGDENTFLDLENTEGERTVTLDLGEISYVNEIAIISGGISWDDKITQCEISYSSDGVNWTKLGDYESTTGEYALSDAAISARYIRITVLNDGWITIREFAAG